MRVSDFVNGLADNPESNIVHEVPGGTYEVTIVEVSTHVYRVDADDADEAEQIARNRYNWGEDGDLEGVIPSDIDSVTVKEV